MKTVPTYVYFVALATKKFIFCYASVRTLSSSLSFCISLSRTGSPRAIPNPCQWSWILAWAIGKVGSWREVDLNCPVRRGSKPRGIPHLGKRERERQEYLSRNRTISGNVAITIFMRVTTLLRSLWLRLLQYKGSKNKAEIIFPFFWRKNLIHIVGFLNMLPYCTCNVMSK